MGEAIDLRRAGALRVTTADVRRFEGVVHIQDRAAFVVELQALVREKLASAGPGRAINSSVDRMVARKARALRAETTWEPSASELQRGRRALLEAFALPHNLPLPEFARLAGKSRQMIYKDLAARPRRLLALSVGPRRQRLPDWQLDPRGLSLTRQVLVHAPEVDAWTVYRALSEPLEGLGDQSPVKAVGRQRPEVVARAVLDALDIETDGATR